MRASSSSGPSAVAALGCALLLAAAHLPAAHAISQAQARNLTRVLYIHNYPTMLFYKSMYTVSGVGGGGWVGVLDEVGLAGLAQGIGGIDWWEMAMGTAPSAPLEPQTPKSPHASRLPPLPQHTHTHTTDRPTDRPTHTHTHTQDIIAPGPPYKWNQFVVQDKLPDAKTGGPNANVDFLHATAWIDTRDDPIVLTIPVQDNPERYMSVQTTFIKGFETEYVGTRMAGKEEAAADYYIQSPATKLKTDPGACAHACERPSLLVVVVVMVLVLCRGFLFRFVLVGGAGEQARGGRSAPPHQLTITTSNVRTHPTQTPPPNPQHNKPQTTKPPNDAGGLFKTILYSDSDYSRVQARVGPITGPADVDQAKALLAKFKVQPLTHFLEPQIGQKAIVSVCVLCLGWLVGRLVGWLVGPRRRGQGPLPPHAHSHPPHTHDK
jgi:hypothetical protein